jgi:hypothetical protein
VNSQLALKLKEALGLPATPTAERATALKRSHPPVQAHTPASPSRSASARVKYALPVPTVCPHCKGSVRVVAHAEIYGGKSFGEWPWAYACLPGCGAYVGMHPFTNIPLGTLATAEIRKARSACKPAFEALHQTGRMDRNTAYLRLAQKLGIPPRDCHFGWFDAEMCKRAELAATVLMLEAMDESPPPGQA